MELSQGLQHGLDFTLAEVPLLWADIFCPGEVPHDEQTVAAALISLAVEDFREGTLVGALNGMVKKLLELLKQVCVDFRFPGNCLKFYTIISIK